MSEKVTYKNSGVDIDAGLESLRRIKSAAVSTHSESTLAGLGGFGSLFDLGSALREYKQPVLVQSVDGVGTKLMVANMTGRYDTVGEDIVNHCCNDIVCQGARPLTFLDYIAMEKMNPVHIEQLVGGMAKACRACGVSLVGGETAELPGVYAKGEYDLVGVITGVVEKPRILTGESIEEGDTVLGLASSGLHTNGYTLARKVLFDKLGFTVHASPPELGRTVGEALLEPHRNYSRPLLNALDSFAIKGLAHITGGGFYDNIPRILPSSTDAVITKDSWSVPPVFGVIGKGGDVPEEDMYRTFNMGIGMIAVVEADQGEAMAGALRKDGEEVYEIGKIVTGSGRVQIR